jgi:hypothetical protein
MKLDFTPLSDEHRARVEAIVKNGFPAHCHTLALAELLSDTLKENAEKDDENRRLREALVTLSAPEYTQERLEELVRKGHGEANVSVFPTVKQVIKARALALEPTAGNVVPDLRDRMIDALCKEIHRQQHTISVGFCPTERDTECLIQQSKGKGEKVKNACAVHWRQWAERKAGEQPQP